MIKIDKLIFNGNYFVLFKGWYLSGISDKNKTNLKSFDIESK